MSRIKKDTVLLVCSIIFTLSVIAGFIYILTRDKTVLPPGDVPIDVEYKLAENLIVAKASGKVDLVKSRTGEVLSSIAIGDGAEGDFLYTSNSGENCIYIYSKNEKAVYKVEAQSGNLNQSKIIDVVADIEAVDFKCDGKTALLLSEDRKILAVAKNDGKTSIATSEKEMMEIALSETNFAYATQEHIYRGRLENIEVDGAVIENIELGDRTTGLYFVDNKLLVFNEFGSTMKKFVILKINADNLYVESMIKYDGLGVRPVSPDKFNKEIVYAENVAVNDEEVRVLTLLNTENMTKKNSNIKVDGAKLNDDNSEFLRGYLYSSDSNSIGIFDLRSKQRIYSYDMENVYVAPVITEQS